MPLVIAREEYDALELLFTSTNGQNWIWKSDYPKNGYPWRFDDYVNYNPCNKYWQGLLCMAATDCGTVDNPCRIIFVELTALNLSGTIPVGLFSAFQTLIGLAVTENPFLQGPVPHIRGISLLSNANFSYNAFTGPITDDYFNSTGLNVLYYSYNSLNGTIPQELYSLSALNYFHANNNTLSGSISKAISNLTELIFFSAPHNQLEGTIPPELFSMRNLSQIYLSDNRFVGTLPENLGHYLEVFRISENHLAGTIPASLCANKKLQLVTLYDNALTGSLPPCLSQLSALEFLQVQRNFLTGNVDLIFNASSQHSLGLIDISDNSFSGSVPQEMFRLPSLVNVAAGKNCFEGQLPKSLCEAGALLQVVALDGLGASDTCIFELWDPWHLSNSFFGGLLQGTLPECIWSLPNITTLHMAGNGLTGTLPDGITLSPTLKDVILTHNLLEGTIPETFQKTTFTSLDLSYNKFKGDITRMTNLTLAYAPNATGMSINFEVNRLSGHIPDSFYTAYNIDILTGNLFACNVDHPELVQHDPGSNTVICGAQQLTSSISTYVIYVFFVLLLTAIRYLWLWFFRRNKQRVIKVYHSFVSTWRYCQEVSSYSIPTPAELQVMQSARNTDVNLRKRQYYQVFQLLSTLTLIRRISWIVLVYSLLVCLPTYLGFYSADNNRYSMHTDRYSWASSAVFLTGRFPAVILYLQWTFLTLIVLRVIVGHYNLHRLNENAIVDSMIRRLGDASFKIRESLLGPSTRPTVYTPLLPSADHPSWMPMSQMEDKAEGGMVDGRHSESGNRSAESLAREEDGDGVVFDELSLSCASPLSPLEGTPPPPASVREMRIVSELHFLPTEEVGERERESASLQSYAEHDPENLETPSMRESFLSRFSMRGSRTGQTRRNTLSERIPFFTIDNMSQLLANERFKQRWINALRFSTVIFVNVTVIVLTNVAYLIAENDDNIAYGWKAFIQVLMAGFKILWNIFALRILIARLPYQKASIKLHVAMLVFNSLLAPCLATSFTDSSCFRDAFVSAPTITVSYNSHTCVDAYQVWDYKTGEVTTVCSHYSDVEVVTYFTPPFVYYYTCASKLLTVYTPVYIYIYTMLITFLPVMYLIFASVSKKYIPSIVLSQVDGILRPHERGIVAFSKLIRPQAMQAIMVHHLIVLLTFGVVCPVLALVISTALMMDTFMWQLIITRYILYENDSTPFSPNYVVGQEKGLPYEGLEEADRSTSQKEETSEAVSPLAASVQKGSGCISPATSPCSEVSPKPVTTTSSSLSSHVEEKEDPAQGAAASSGSNDSSEPASRASDIMYRLLYSAHGSHGRDESAVASGRRPVDEHVKEEARLYELHTVCGESWQTVRASMWQMMYIAMFFYALILFNYAGDDGSWVYGLWVLIVTPVVAILVRWTFVDVVRFIYYYSFGGRYVYSDIVTHD